MNIVCGLLKVCQVSLATRGKSHESTIAIVGATSAVGRELVRLLELRDFPVKQLTLLASEKTAGQSILFKKRELLREIRVVLAV